MDEPRHSEGEGAAQLGLDEGEHAECEPHNGVGVGLVGAAHEEDVGAGGGQLGVLGRLQRSGRVGEHVEERGWELVVRSQALCILGGDGQHGVHPAQGLVLVALHHPRPVQLRPGAVRGGQLAVAPALHVVRHEEEEGVGRVRPHGAAVAHEQRGQRPLPVPVVEDAGGQWRPLQLRHRVPLARRSTRRRGRARRASRWSSVSPGSECWTSSRTSTPAASRPLSSSSSRTSEPRESNSGRRSANTATAPRRGDEEGNSHCPPAAAGERKSHRRAAAALTADRADEGGPPPARGEREPR